MITQQEYQARRERFAQKLPPGAITFIPAAQEVVRNGDAHYRFRQDSNFYYLTGFNEPEAVLVILKGEPNQSLLFNRCRHLEAEIWTGKRLGQEGACQELGMSLAFPIEDFKTKLPELLLGKTVVYYPMGCHRLFEQQLLAALQQAKSFIRRGMKAPQTLCDLEPLLSEMRLIKSEAEVALMRKAAEISVAAHKKAMQACRKAQFEYQIEAALLYEFAYQGCRAVAYDSIVGGGANSCVLHYTDNNQPLQPQQLLLIDAGGEFENYAADITRTFPIGGKFSAEQKAIYELVLKAQRAAISCIKPGLAWNKLQQAIVRILTVGLCELGLLQGPIDILMEKEAYKPFYMHNSGHWLGLDVHDAGSYKINGKWRPLEAGMVLTVEPGLYIRPETGVDSRWWNIGVRIEDDVLVTADGYDILTSDLPVSVAEIEALLSE